MEANKQLLLEHREQLKRMIEACKALHEGFEDQRKEVKAEKMKKIRHAISNGILVGILVGILNSVFGLYDGIPMDQITIQGADDKLGQTLLPHLKH